MRFRRRQRGTQQPSRPFGGGEQSDFLSGLGVTTRFGERTVLDGVDLAVQKGEIFVIIGPSGCGKTTLLRHLAGMVAPTRGKIWIDDHEVYALGAKELDALRRRMGFSFQGGALLNSMSLIDNVALPLLEAAGDLPPPIIRQTARLKLEMVGLLHAAELPPAELSGGMRKRAAIARAVALDPELVFFDEPSAGLDPITAAEVDNLILKLNKIFGITMVVVTHDIASAFTIADRMMLLFEAKVQAAGTPSQVQAIQESRVQDFIHRALPSEEGRGVDVMHYLAT